MPPNNHFRHQTYSDAVPTSPHRFMRPALEPAAGSAEFLERMRRVGVAFRRNGVAAVYLIHGTFVGRDPMGLVEALRRVMPGAGEALRDKQSRQPHGEE